MTEHVIVSPLAIGGLELRVRARQIGDVLYATWQGNVFLKMTDAQIRDAFSELMTDIVDKHYKGLYPMSESYRLRTLMGTVVLDATLTEETVQELVAYILDQDVGPELLERYKPE